MIGLEDAGWLNDNLIDFMAKSINFYNFLDDNGEFVLANNTFGSTVDFTTIISLCSQRHKQISTLQTEWDKEKKDRIDKVFSKKYRKWIMQPTENYLWNMLMSIMILQ